MGNGERTFVGWKLDVGGWKLEAAFRVLHLLKLFARPSNFEFRSLRAARGSPIMAGLYR